LKGVFSSANDIINWGTLLELNPFSIRNAEKTRDDFQSMVGVEPAFGPSAGIRVATSGLYTDIFVIAIIFIGGNN